MSPPFGQIASFADAMSPAIMDRVRNQGFKLFEDSAAGGSMDRRSSMAEVSRARYALLFGPTATVDMVKPQATAMKAGFEAASCSS